MSGTGRIVSVNRGRVTALAMPHRQARSAIDKRPVDGPVAVGILGLEGDEQYERRFHGGPSKAVYVYAHDDLVWWSAELARELPYGFIGENLTVDGIDLHDLRPGDELHAGSTVLAVTEPREPCSKLAARIGIRGFEKRFAHSLRLGVYCAVVRAGTLQRGDVVTVVRTSTVRPTIREAAAARYGVAR